MAALGPDLLSLLRKHPLIKTVRVVHYDETPWGKVELKVRCLLMACDANGNNYQFQVWLHHEPAFQDYAYQLFSDQPLLRWDNAPHYPTIPTAPHHFHDETGKVGASPLSGSSLVDLSLVLAEVEKWITALSTQV